MAKPRPAGPSESNRAETRTAVLLLGLLLAVSQLIMPHKTQAALLQDFEKDPSPLTVWVVNIPNGNASVQLSTDQPHDGNQCLKLHYHFVGAGQFQYVGIPNKVHIQSRVHTLRFWLKGDNSKSSYGVQLS